MNFYSVPNLGESGTPVFSFMTIRMPQTLTKKALSHFYIKDDYVTEVNENEKPLRIERDILSWNARSEVGRLVFRHIFCGPDEESYWIQNEDLINSVTALITSRQPMCDEGSSEQDIDFVRDLDRYPYIKYQNQYYLLPEKLEDNKEIENVTDLINCRDLIMKHVNKFEKRKLIAGLKQILNVDFLYQYVFKGESYTTTFQSSKAKLFDLLYTLYILRRKVAVNLEYIMQGLQTLHVIEWLAIDEFLAGVMEGSIDENNVKRIIDMLTKVFPEMDRIKITANMQPISFINDAKELNDYFSAVPIIHPIFPKLHWYKQPFNDLKPIGIGDLKVVKQQLIGYKASEISHIMNIMKGEDKQRDHRRLEKTEEVMSFSSDQSTESERETQSTDRFEVKREAESVIKSDLQVNANASLTYASSASPITASISGGFAYSNSHQDSQKIASNFAHDVMDKAVTRVQNRTQQQRSITKIFETEETNVQKFLNNTSTHTSGIYRWVDKKYRSQVYNYGKRMMFEFIIPEPAAMFVEARKRAFEWTVDCPNKPKGPLYKPLDLGFKFSDIDEDKFKDLCTKYDLKRFSYPPNKTIVQVIDEATRESLLKGENLNASDKYYSKTYICKAGIRNYKLNRVKITGRIEWLDDWSSKNGINPGEDNTFGIVLNGEHAFAIARNHDKQTDKWELFKGQFESIHTGVFVLGSDEFNLTLEFTDINNYELSIAVELERTQQFLQDWQLEVYDEIRKIEQVKIDKINQEIELDYNAKMADYRNKVNELTSQTINDLIQGKTEAFNKEIIRQELKKQCISFIAREFDSLEYDDILSREDAIDMVDVTVHYDKYLADDGECGFITKSKDVGYPKINLKKAKTKARFIQFLEQAFEWQHIAYIFYPYFWAKENKWLGLMNRLDNTDPHMTAFLQAGSVRVLLAVTPAYDSAVLHFLATREPWQGGPVPVIGDPLFLPVFEEIKKQQDDIENATAEGKPWEFTLPTNLIYLHDSSSKLPDDFDK